MDTLAQSFDCSHSIPYMWFSYQYDLYGRCPTVRRNTQIVEEASNVIAFPSADSKGKFHSIKEAHRLSRQAIVVNL